MYSLNVVLMVTQSLQAERDMEIDYLQMIQTASARKTGRPTLSEWLVQLYRTTFEKVRRFSNYGRDESKVAEYS